MTEHRRPEDAAGRSDATAEIILAAARDRFAVDGYDRATIGAIAREAGFERSVVLRHYGSKAALFAAASQVTLRLPPIGQMPPENVGAALVHHFFERWEQDEVLTTLLRVGITDAAGTRHVRQIFREQMAPVVAALCPDPAQAPARAALVASQILGMALSRYVLKFPPAVAMSRAEIVAWMGPTVQRYLTADSP